MSLWRIEDPGLPLDVRRRLVDRLYSKGVSTVVAMVNGTFVAGMCWLRSGDGVYLALGLLTILLMLDRGVVVTAFRRNSAGRSTVWWVRRFLVGSVGYALAMGGIGFLAISQSDPYIVAAGVGGVLATLAVAVARYSTHPPIVMSQILILLGGLGAAMLLRADPFFQVHGVMLLLFGMSLTGVLRVLHDGETALLLERHQTARLVEELEAQKRALELESRAKSDFLANMSHELRTPLNAIIGFADLIAQDGVADDRPNRLRLQEMPAQHRDWSLLIRQSGEHLLGQINDILDLARIAGGNLPLEEEVFDLALLVQQTGAWVQPQVANRSLILTCSTSTATLPFRGDARRLRQVMLNLLSNASKFTPAGGHVVLALAQGTDGVEILVEDTGIGIGAEHMGRVLEMFGQVESGWTRRNAGAGIGLPMAKHLVEQHGGRLLLHSVPGQGTRVRVLLPADRVVSPAPHPAQQRGDCRQAHAS